MKVIRNCKGGITIFQCLLFTALLLFSGVIIDVARIMAAERKVQSAVNTAVRSTLASYDGDMAGDYGLFVVNDNSDTSLEERFNKYLLANLNSTAEEFQFIRYQMDPEHTTVESSGNLLANHPNALKEQIMKYMKYKAPVTIAGNVLDKLKNSGLFKKLEFAEKEKEARGARNELKGDIDRINVQVREINQKINTASRLEGRAYIDVLKSLQPKLSQAVTYTEEMDAVCEKYTETRKEADEIAAQANTEEILQQEGVQIQSQGKEFLNALDESQAIKQTLSKYENDIAEMIKKIEPMQNQIDRLERQKSDLEYSNRMLALALGMAQGDVQALIAGIQRNNEAISRITAEIGEIQKEIRGIRSSANIMQVNEINAQEAGDDSQERPSGEPDFTGLDVLSVQLEQYLKDIQIREEWLINPEELTQANAEEKKIIDEMKEKNNRNKNVLMKESDGARAEEENDSILDFMKRLNHEVIDFFSQGAQNSVEKMYVTEYIMDKFTYHTSETEREHYFKKGEVEYILWGDRNENKNIAATVTSIGFIRFGIDTIDYFATSKVPHPVLRIVYAVGRGLLQSVEDTYQLYRGKEIPLCPSLRGKAITLKLNYSDHLRLFLLMQSVKDENEQLNNLRQLVQVNMKQAQGVDAFWLRDCNTRISASATVEINLLFLPALHLDQFNVNGFRNGKYVITKECHMGY